MKRAPLSVIQSLPDISTLSLLYFKLKLTSETYLIEYNRDILFLCAENSLSQLNVSAWTIVVGSSIKCPTKGCKFQEFNNTYILIVATV